MRYASGAHLNKTGATRGSGPVVVWNCTRACNLSCRHCYADARRHPHDDELSTWEGKRLIDDLAAFRVPVLLFSGGEPLMRDDIFDLIEYAAAAGIRPVLSTNGTLITGDTAAGIRSAGTGYVGVSLDGTGATHDSFRRLDGSFQMALNGIRACLAAGQRVGLRFTISRCTFGELGAVFDLVRREGIPRVCFYHLVASGRGGDPVNEDITPQQKREALDLIIDRTLELYKDGIDTEILTVDNHADGIYLYRKLKKIDPERARTVIELLKNNGGNRSGIAFGCVDCRGNVHPDQFTHNITFGNVRQRSFSQIWTDDSNPLLDGFRDRRNRIKGRCGRCRWMDLCNGNLRARALYSAGDLWASDPGCYLSDHEIDPD